MDDNEVTNHPGYQGHAEGVYETTTWSPSEAQRVHVTVTRYICYHGGWSTMRYNGTDHKLQGYISGAELTPGMIAMDPITYRPVFIVRRDGNNVVLQRDQLADTVDLLSDTYATPWSPYRLAWPVYAQTQSITHVDSPGAAPSTRWDATEGELNIAFAELHSAREVFQAVQNRSALPIVLAQWHEASEQRMGEVAFVASKKWHSRFTPGADEDSDGHGSVSAPTATGAVYDHPLPDDGQHVAMVTEQE